MTLYPKLIEEALATVIYILSILENADVYN